MGGGVHKTSWSGRGREERGLGPWGNLLVDFLVGEIRSNGTFVYHLLSLCPSSSPPSLLFLCLSLSQGLQPSFGVGGWEQRVGEGDSWLFPWGSYQLPLSSSPHPLLAAEWEDVWAMG